MTRKKVLKNIRRQNAFCLGGGGGKDGPFKKICEKNIFLRSIR